MAANYTSNYSLCQWEPSDPFIRTDFNEDNAKIDAALHNLETGKATKTELAQVSSGKVDKATLTALQTQVTSVQNELTQLSSSKADKSAVADLQTQVTTVASDTELRCRMKAGSYTGDGASSRTIDVGFTVAAVLVENRTGIRNYTGNAATVGGLAVKGSSLYHGATILAVSGTGFRVYNAGEYQGRLNSDGIVYHYVAWG